MTLIAIPAGNGGQVGDGLVDSLAVDGRIGRALRRKLPAKKRFFEFIQSGRRNLRGRPRYRVWSLRPGERHQDRARSEESAHMHLRRLDFGFIILPLGGASKPT